MPLGLALLKGPNSMWVRAVGETFDCPTHKIAPGRFAELDEHTARAGIEAGKLEEASLEEYQASLIEKRAPKPRGGRPKAREGDSARVPGQ